jgi:alcohol dehydrogenase (cytochrome c)
MNFKPAAVHAGRAPRRPMFRPLIRIAASGLLGAGLFCAAGLSAAAAAPPLNVDWRGYNNTYDGQRFSALTAINRGNVKSLRPACEVALGDDGSFQSGLVVVGNSLFVTTAHTVVALDATDCSVQWRYVYTPEEDEVMAVNRGVAYADGRLFRGTADGRFLAIDAKTGKEIWRIQAGDPKIGEFFSQSPVAWNGMVFTGAAGGDWGIMGRVVALDAATGKELWRFHTIPTGDEPGASTWKDPASAKNGGGGTWTTFTLDPTTGELFVPVGNPAADFAAVSRPGDNLYTDSMVALDARTGAVSWYYQLVQNDTLDYDLGAAPALYTDAQGRARVAIGGKDGHLYSVDRATHATLFKTPLTTIKNADAVPTEQGVHACPGPQGGVEWNGPAYSPLTGDVYVGTVDWCATFKRGDIKKVDSPLGAGKIFFGTGYTMDPKGPHTGWVSAVDGVTGKVRWRHHMAAPVVAGVTPTASGLVFAGDLSGNFVALDAASGKPLKKLAFASPMAGGVVTYAVEGRQYVALTTGNVSRLVWHTIGSPKLVIMATGLAPGYALKQVSAIVPGEKLGRAPAATDQQGAEAALFVQHCAVCHGSHGEGVSGPALIGESARKTVAQTVDWIKNPQPPMPKLYPSQLSDADVDQLADYVSKLK